MYLLFIMLTRKLLLLLLVEEHIEQSVNPMYKIFGNVGNYH